MLLRNQSPLVKSGKLHQFMGDCKFQMRYSVLIYCLINIINATCSALQDVECDDH